MRISYDVETYPNIFTITFEDVDTGRYWQYEISDRVHQGVEIYHFLTAISNSGGVMIGFNNFGFDYPIVHIIWESQGRCSCFDLYQKCQAIIQGDNVFDHVIWPNNQLAKQIDLFKINHFDNAAKSTSLKVLEFNMRSPNIEDLPFAPGTILNDEQKDTLLVYNLHDVRETTKFFLQKSNQDAIAMREELTELYGKDFTNSNDTKIGADYFAMCLEEVMPGCTKNKTHRPIIHLNEAVFPYIQFEQPEFQRMCDWFKTQSIRETKGVFADLHCCVNGFTYHFGAGGIHGSIESRTIHSDDQYLIIDLDVASYYPNLAIKNKVYPQHLSEKFCEIYEEVFNKRREYAKGTAGNAMLKLALNGVYGKSNSHYSPFYDPLYTMTITINGQLLLCLLAENLLKIPGLEMIQINTDGLTVRVDRKYVDNVTEISQWWESFTHLELERNDYRSMYIRDVNNYIAVYLDGEVKRKGAYEYELDWHQNHSQLIVPKVTEQVLLYGGDITDLVHSHSDFYDFCLRVKAPRSNRVEWGDEIVQNTTRYYVSTQGRPLYKIGPPPKGYQVGQWRRANGVPDSVYNGVISELRELASGHRMVGDQLDVTGLPWDERINTKNQSVYKDRVEQQCKGYQVTVCNDIMHAVNPINYDYYINEVNKLVRPLC